MSEKYSGSVSRRDLLKKTAVAGAATTGIIGAGSNSVSASRPKVEEVSGPFDPEIRSVKDLRAEGVVHGPEFGPEDVTISEEIRTGKKLLRRLYEDGVLESPTLQELPSYAETAESKGGVYRLRSGGGVEVGFVTATPQGELQVTFSENVTPFAVLRSDDDGPAILYTSSDGMITTTEHGSGSTDDPGTDQYPCSPSWCGGCTCESTICRWSLNAVYCDSCWDGKCRTTSDCGCD